MEKKSSFTPSSKNNKPGEEDTEIERLQREQKIEALKAGFKTAEEFMEAIENLKKREEENESKREELNEEVAALNEIKEALDKKKEEIEAEAAENQSTIQNRFNLLKEAEEKQKQRFKDERESKERENKALFKYLDDLAKSIYNLHPQYISHTAIRLLHKSALPIFNAHGLPVKFDEKGQYIELFSMHHGQDKGYTDTPQLPQTGSNGNLPTSMNRSFNLILSLYKYIQNEQRYGYDFAVWLHLILRNVQALSSGNEERLRKNADNLLEHYSAVNRGIVNLAESYQNDKRPPSDVDYVEIFKYLISVSNKLEQILGIGIIEED